MAVKEEIEEEKVFLLQSIYVKLGWLFVCFEAGDRASWNSLCSSGWPQPHLPSSASWVLVLETNNPPPRSNCPGSYIREKNNPATHHVQALSRRHMEEGRWTSWCIPRWQLEPASQPCPHSPRKYFRRKSEPEVITPCWLRKEWREGAGHTERNTVALSLYFSLNNRILPWFSKAPCPFRVMAFKFRYWRWFKLDFISSSAAWLSLAGVNSHKGKNMFWISELKRRVCLSYLTCWVLKLNVGTPGSAFVSHLMWCVLVAELGASSTANLNVLPQSWCADSQGWVTQSLKYGWGLEMVLDSC